METKDIGDVQEGLDVVGSLESDRDYTNVELQNAAWEQRPALSWGGRKGLQDWQEGREERELRVDQTPIHGGTWDWCSGLFEKKGDEAQGAWKWM